MYLITLYFDKKTTEELQRWIALVARETDNTFMTENHVPPHMTLCAFDAPDEETAKRLFEEMSLPVAGDVQLVSLGAFLPHVLYVGAVYCEYLHRLSLCVDSVLKRDTSVRIRQAYRPFSWIPHVTIGKQLTKVELNRAFAVLQERFHVIKGSVVRIGLSATNPYRDLEIRELS